MNNIIPFKAKPKPKTPKPKKPKRVTFMEDFQEMLVRTGLAKEEEKRE